MSIIRSCALLKDFRTVYNIERERSIHFLSFSLERQELIIYIWSYTFYSIVSFRKTMPMREREKSPFLVATALIKHIRMTKTFTSHSAKETLDTTGSVGIREHVWKWEQTCLHLNLYWTFCSQFHNGSDACEWFYAGLMLSVV
jgi:hypothetical protein